MDRFLPSFRSRTTVLALVGWISLASSLRAQQPPPQPDPQAPVLNFPSPTGAQRGATLDTKTALELSQGF